MYPEGHAGLSLGILSLAVTLLNWTGLDAIVFCLAVTAFSSLPDLDLKLRPLIKHRSPLTHSLFAGVLFGAGFAFVARYAGLNPWLGFACGFGGTGLHVLGDVLTFSKIKPLWPFSRRSAALGLFRSSNRPMNALAAGLGGLMFLSVVLRYVGFAGIT